MKPDIAVNKSERMRLRGMRAGSRQRQQRLEALSWEVGAIRVTGPWQDRVDQLARNV